MTNKGRALAWTALIAATLANFAGTACKLFPTEPPNPPYLGLDAAGDFLPAYTGPRTPDLDLASAQVWYDGSSFHFHLAVVGIAGTTPGSAYVFGVNRGQGTARFATHPKIVPDALVILRPGSGITIVDLVSGDTTGLPASSLEAAGAFVDAIVPPADLPSRGLAPGQFTVAGWSRSGLNGGDEQIADFVPNNGMLPVRNGTFPY
jgi:hypothetical protein